VNSALSPRLGRLLLWTTFERADRPRADSRLAVAKHSSEKAAPVELVLVQMKRLRLIEEKHGLLDEAT
jgi:hypothetical protein